MRAALLVAAVLAIGLPSSVLAQWITPSEPPTEAPVLDAHASVTTEATVEASASAPLLTTAAPDVVVVEQPPPVDRVVLVERAREPPAPVDPGTHSILELALGATLTNGGGFSGDLLYGYGGRPFGLPTPVYLIADLGYTTLGTGGMLGGVDAYSDERSYLHLSLGLRIYVPIFEIVRIFAEGTFGAAFASSRLQRAGLAPFDEDGWYAAGAVGGGIQVRIIDAISVGVGVQALFTDDDLSALRRTMGARDEIPVRLQGTATWHF